MKNAFMLGLGLGFVAGHIIMKKCPAVQQLCDDAENAVKTKVQEVKTKIEEKKQAKDDMSQNNQAEFAQDFSQDSCDEPTQYTQQTY